MVLSLGSYFILVFFQFSDVFKLVIIHKNIQPKFGCRPYMKAKKKKYLYFGYMLKPVVKIWWFFFFFEKWRIRGFNFVPCVFCALFNMLQFGVLGNFYPTTI